MASQKKKLKPVLSPVMERPLLAPTDRICRIALLVLVLWSPYFRGLYFDYERFPFYAVFCVLVLACFGLRAFYRTERLNLGLPALILLLIVALYALNLPLAADRGLAYRGFLSLAVLFLLFLAARELFAERFWKQIALLGFILNGSFLVFLGYAYRFGWIPPLARPLGMDLRELFLAGRLHSVFQYPNTTAAYFAMGFLASLILLLSKPGRVWRLVISFAGFFLLAGLFFTFSRGGLLTFTLSVAFILFVLPRGNRAAFFVRALGQILVLAVVLNNLNRYLIDGEGGRFFLVIVGGGALCMLAEMTLFPLLGGERPLKRVNFRPGLVAALLIGLLLVIGLGDLNPAQHFSRFWGFSWQDQSVFERLLFYRDAWSMVRERPLAGWGGGGWPALYLGYRSAPYTTENPHNYFVQVLVEGGIVGFLLLIVLLGSLFGGVLMARGKNDPEETIISVGMLGIVFMGFVHGIVDVNFALGSYALAVWFFAGAAAGRLNELSTSALFRKRIPVRWSFLTGGAFLLLVFSVLAIDGTRYAKWADIYARRGELEYARFFYQRAVSRDFWNAEAWYALSRINRQFFHAGRGDFYRASSLDAARRAVDIAPFQPYFLEHLGLLHLEMGQFDRGLALMEEAAKRNPLTAEAFEHLMIGYRTVGDFYLNRNERDLARRYYELALLAAESFRENRERSLRPVREGNVEALRREIEALL